MAARKYSVKVIPYFSHKDFYPESFYLELEVRGLKVGEGGWLYSLYCTKQFKAVWTHQAVEAKALSVLVFPLLAFSTIAIILLNNIVFSFFSSFSWTIV